MARVPRRRSCSPPEDVGEIADDVRAGPEEDELRSPNKRGALSLAPFATVGATLTLPLPSAHTPAAPAPAETFVKLALTRDTDAQILEQLRPYVVGEVHTPHGNRALHAITPSTQDLLCVYHRAPQALVEALALRVSASDERGAEPEAEEAEEPGTESEGEVIGFTSFTGSSGRAPDLVCGTHADPNRATEAHRDGQVSANSEDTEDSRSGGE